MARTDDHQLTASQWAFVLMLTRYWMDRPKNARGLSSWARQAMDHYAPLLEADLVAFEHKLTAQFQKDVGSLRNTEGRPGPQ